MEGVDVKLALAAGGKLQVVLEGDAKVLLAKLKETTPDWLDMVIDVVGGQLP